MPKFKYKNKRFTLESQAIIDNANVIVEAYQAQGLVLTLRQLFYQFVSRDWLPNTQKNYDRLGDVISNARIAGLLDWDAIEDRTRSLEKNSHWTTPNDIIESCADSYQLDKWEGQEYQPEVWIEKEALAGVLVRPCGDLDVPFFACRGYVSQSSMREAAVRLLRYRRMRREPVILHFGDHDPSGIDMTRDIADRLTLFMLGRGPTVIRVALTMDQVTEYQPPPNPAKTTDGRFAAYQAEYGDESWELDALDPATLAGLVRENVLRHRDEDTWDARVEQEQTEQRQLAKAARHWDAVVDKLDTIEERVCSTCDNIIPADFGGDDDKCQDCLDTAAAAEEGNEDEEIDE